MFTYVRKQFASGLLLHWNWTMPEFPCSYVQLQKSCMRLKECKNTVKALISASSDQFWGFFWGGVCSNFPQDTYIWILLFCIYNSKRGLPNRKVCLELLRARQNTNSKYPWCYFLLYKWRYWLTLPNGVSNTSRYTLLMYCMTYLTVYTKIYPKIKVILCRTAATQYEHEEILIIIMCTEWYFELKCTPVLSSFI